jgi:hypothetical protein
MTMTMFRCTFADYLETPLTHLMFICPRTNRLAPTNVNINLAEIDRLPIELHFPNVLIATLCTVRDQGKLLFPKYCR